MFRIGRAASRTACQRGASAR
ncbi:hypothetical protein CXB36_12485 [Pseudomonas syringae pv. syringae]|nr:hypothetical protein BKC06_022315 [Pseudomonas syringae pv. syringae]PBP38061.1 hypothetical protein CCL11_22545 [Pseudomonas syringae]PBP85419.1 hypothetical protein CCL16_15150 [Pseudomonas syringae]POP64967.1 hypothetical protein CXB36_12485 [Pseudomonas syringae pv. syringae]